MSDTGAGAGEAGLNFVRLLADTLPQSSISRLLTRYENVIFTVITILLLSALAFFASRNAKLIPGRFQAAFETLVEALDAFVRGILGPGGRKYTPFLGTLFLYILCLNWLGLFPLMKSPTGASMTLRLGSTTIPIPTVTVALAVLVFLYVQLVGLKQLGILGYLDHMAGNPRGVFGFILIPIMLVIHVIGEFARPFSLAYRLFGNLLGEDVLLAVFVGLGVAAFKFLPVPAGLPFQVPFIFLALVTSTIQAFVFTLLSTVYIAMMLPHDEKILRSSLADSG